MCSNSLFVLTSNEELLNENEIEMNLTILPILNLLLLPNYGTVFHLTNIINIVNTNDVNIFNIDNNNHDVKDIVDYTLKFLKYDRAVTVLHNIDSNQKLMNQRTSALNIVFFDNSYKVCIYPDKKI